MVRWQIEHVAKQSPVSKVGKEGNNTKGENVRMMVIVEHHSEAKQLGILPEGSPIENDGQIVTQVKHDMSQQQNVSPKLVLYIAPPVTGPIPERSSDNSFGQDGYEDGLGGVRYDKVDVDDVGDGSQGQRGCTLYATIGNMRSI